MTAIQQECIRRIAEAKALPEDAVTTESSLDDLGVDSLDRVTLSFDLEEEYGVVIPEAKLHQIRTVQDVIDAVQESLAAKQQTATPGGTLAS